MANWSVPSPFPDQLGQGPKNWYHSSHHPVLEAQNWQGHDIYGGSRAPQGSHQDWQPWQRSDPPPGTYGDRCSIGHDYWQRLPQETPFQPPIASLSSQLRFQEDPRERIVEESLRSVEGMLLNLDKQFETLDWWMQYRKFPKQSGKHQQFHEI